MVKLYSLSPIIMEVENGYIWKVTTIGGTHFSLPWLWEEVYMDELLGRWLLHRCIQYIGCTIYSNALDASRRRMGARNRWLLSISESILRAGGCTLGSKLSTFSSLFLFFGPFGTCVHGPDSWELKCVYYAAMTFFILFCRPIDFHENIWKLSLINYASINNGDLL